MLHFQSHSEVSSKTPVLTTQALSSLPARFLHISKQLLHVDLAVIGGMCSSVIYRATAWCQLTRDKLHNIPKGSFA